MLLGEALDLFVVRVHVAVLIGAGAVEHHDERKCGLTIPCGGYVEAIADRFVRGGEIVGAMQVALGAQLLVRRRQNVFRQLPGFRNLLIRIESGAKRD